ncbi:MAG: YlxR family protein [Clostridia bacterium]|nr:YlxR family protein [Clostridia bacterium]
MNGVQQKKIPLRKCTGCGEMKPKKELVRVVKTPEDEILIDLTGRKNGRGAYICRDVECLKKARKAKRIEKSFQCNIPDEVYDKMEQELTSGE